MFLKGLTPRTSSTGRGRGAAGTPDNRSPPGLSRSVRGCGPRAARSDGVRALEERLEPRASAADGMRSRAPGATWFRTPHGRSPHRARRPRRALRARPSGPRRFLTLTPSGSSIIVVAAADRPQPRRRPRSESWSKEGSSPSFTIDRDWTSVRPRQRQAASRLWTDGGSPSRNHKDAEPIRGGRICPRR